MRPGLRLYLIKPGLTKIEVSKSNNLTLHQIVSPNADFVIILNKTLT